MAVPPRESSKERLAAAQARAAAAADVAAAREDGERAKASRAKLDRLLKLDAATRYEALSDGTDDLIPADRRRLVRSLEGQPPPPLQAPSDRKTPIDRLVGHHPGGGSWAGRFMGLWQRLSVVGREGTPVVARATAPRGTGKIRQAPARTGPVTPASPSRRPPDRSPEHVRPVGSMAHPPHAVDVAEPAAAIQGSPDHPFDLDSATMSSPLIRRGATPETIRRLRSAAQVDRLKALPTAELAGAVATGATADLTDDDKRQVVDLLIARGHAPHVDAFAPGARPPRKPVAMTGNGLPCYPGMPPRDPRIPVWIVCALAVITWMVMLGLGYAGIASSTFGSP